jgi:hypothetical protein
MPKIVGTLMVGYLGCPTLVAFGPLIDVVHAYDKLYVNREYRHEHGDDVSEHADMIILCLRGDGGRNSPLSFECINDPRGRPNVVPFEIAQDMYDLSPFFRIGYKWSPDEDGVAYCYRQWYSLR